MTIIGSLAVLLFFQLGIVAGALMVWKGLAAEKLRLGGSLRIMRLQSDDVVVLQVKEVLPQTRADDLEAVLAHEFPGHKAIVLHGGWELSVVRPGEELAKP